MQRQRARGRTNATLDPDLRTRLVGDAVEPANQAPLAEQEIRGSEHQSADLALDEQALREPDASQDEQPQTTRDTHSATPVMMNPLGGNPNEENEPAGEAQVPADDVMGEAEIYMAYGALWAGSDFTRRGACRSTKPLGSATQTVRGMC